MFGLKKLAQAVFGTTNDRKVAIYAKRVPAINALEPEFEKLSDAELKGLTAKFRAELAAFFFEDMLLPTTEPETNAPPPPA